MTTNPSVDSLTENSFRILSTRADRSVRFPVETLSDSKLVADAHNSPGPSVHIINASPITWYKLAKRGGKVEQQKDLVIAMS
jgi:hypothetical protein